MKKLVLFMVILGVLITSSLAVDPPSMGRGFVLVEFPVVILPSEDSTWIKWAGEPEGPFSPFPDSAYIYVSTEPGGSRLENYEKVDTTKFIVSNQTSFLDGVPVRGINFYPTRSGIEPGAYYLVVGNKEKDLVSNEIPFIVKHDRAPQPVSPQGDTVNVVTPTFRWNPINNVPYYHVVVSDQPIEIDESDDGEFKIDGVSIIWQAITPNSSITYGAPDPSGTLTATPPPLSPGQEYTWLVLNNYGNNPAFTATDVPLTAGFFIRGEPLLKPVNVYPEDGVEIASESITFRWSNLDSKANTYRMFISKRLSEDDLAGQVVVWDDVFSASDFKGDTAEVIINAKLNLEADEYMWRVIAVDDEGRGTAGAYTGFHYNIPYGGLQVTTWERLSTGAIVPVAGVELKVEVFEGSTENLLFVTNENGWFHRDRSPGRIRITTEKTGFKEAVRTVDIVEGDTVNVNLFLDRADATVYGRVQTPAGEAIPEATVEAVSDAGDTVVVDSDSRGNFVLSAGQDGWSIRARKSGYQTSSAQRLNLLFGENRSLESPLVLTENRFELSGVVRNKSNDRPIVGARVRLYSSAGVMIGEIPSTNAAGEYSFRVESGEYRIVVSLAGFTQVDHRLTVIGDREWDALMESGAYVLRGEVFQRTFGSSGQEQFGLIEGVTVEVRDIPDSNLVASGATDVRGRFSLSLPSATDLAYRVYYSRRGVQPKSRDLKSTDRSILDTLFSYASLEVNTVENGGELGGVTISMLDAGDEVVAQRTTDATGRGYFPSLADRDSLKLSAGKSGYISTSVVAVPFIGSDATLEESDYLSIKDGKLTLGDSQIKSLRVNFEKGEALAKWTLVDYDGEAFLDDDKPIGRLRITAPLTRSFNASDTVDGLGTATYTVRAEVESRPELLPLVRARSVITAEMVGADTINVFSLSLPYRHDSEEISLDGINAEIVLENPSGREIKKATLFYRSEGESSFKESTTENTSEKEIRFTIEPSQTGVNLQYYFSVEDDFGRYGSSNSIYSAPVKADRNLITRLAIFPQVDTVVMGLDGTLVLDARAYYGTNFVEREILSSALDWRSDGDILRLSDREDDKAGQKLSVRRGRSGSTDVVMTFNTSGTGFTLAEGVSNTITLPVKVLPIRVDSVAVRRRGGDRGRYSLLTESFSFRFDAFDSNGVTHNVTPTWSIEPSDYFDISATGVVTSRSKDFIGPVRVKATYGGKHAATYKLASGDPLLIGQRVTASSMELSDGRGLRIELPENLVDTRRQVDLSVYNPSERNAILKSVPQEGVSLASDIYTIRRHRDRFRSAALTPPPGSVDQHQDPVRIAVKIPQSYHSYLDEEGSSFTIAVWDEDSLGWQYSWKNGDGDNATLLSLIGLPEYNPHQTELEFSAGKLLNERDSARIAVVYRSGSKLSAEVNIKPNPFSPFVSPMNDYSHLVGSGGMNRDVLGTGIHVRTMGSSTRDVPSVDIEIFTASGALVWAVRLGNTIPGRDYYVFWDGKTRTDRALYEVIDVREDRVIAPKGDRMSRNGRYYAVVTVDDGDKVKRYTQEIILFK